MKVFLIVLLVVACIAIACGIGALLGLGASYVLGYFGVHVPWYVCWVAIIVLGAIFRPHGSGSK